MGRRDGEQFDPIHVRVLSESQSSGGLFPCFDGILAGCGRGNELPKFSETHCTVQTRETAHDENAPDTVSIEVTHGSVFWGPVWAAHHRIAIRKVPICVQGGSVALLAMTDDCACPVLCTNLDTKLAARSFE
jgi:hypothetical protein